MNCGKYHENEEYFCDDCYVVLKFKYRDRAKIEEAIDRIVKYKEEKKNGNSKR
jgi:hypothetical protein